MARPRQQSGGDMRQGGENEDICPVCKSSRYLNPNMRFLVNPECYHKMCESCVDRIFSHGPAPCPVAGCHRTLRKQRFRKQTFEDIRVEKEVDVRKRISRIFNRREEEFETLRDYNDYLEEIETYTFNLLNNIDLAATESKLSAYASQNASSISQNTAMEKQENESLAAFQAAEQEAARLRRETAVREQEDERREREEGQRDFLDQLTKGKADPEKLHQRVTLKRSSAAQRRANTPAQQPDANGTAPQITLKGLKKVVAPEPEKPYDPFGGLSDDRAYFSFQDSGYENPWLEQAKTDPVIAAGGYDVNEYCTRALIEAFSGLGCFIKEEVAGRDVPASGNVATVAAATAAE